MGQQNWKLYLGENWGFWDGQLTQADGNISGSFVTTGGNWAGGEWCIQATSEKIIVNPGEEYTYSADITATKDMIIRIQIAGGIEEIQVKAGVKTTYKKDFKADSRAFDFIWIFGGGATGEVKNVDFTVSNHRVEAKKEETTTKDVSTTKETTTVAPATTSKNVTVPKASVKSAAKKKTAKKVKLTLKKLYVRVRAIKVVNGKTYTGKWSKPKKVKVKK